MPLPESERSVPSVLLIGASGYIGSRVAHELRALRWTVVGCDRRGAADQSAFSRFLAAPYPEIPDEEIAAADVVLWFAGHSSVKLSQDAPWESLENNVFDLARLFRRVGAAGKPVVYASSASVLSSAEDQYSLIANEVSANAYDAGKLAFDIMAPHFRVASLGLRLATVSGWSPNMRWDLVFNAMNRSAAVEGVVRVQNSSSFRSLLFMDDLCTYIQETVTALAGSTPLEGTRQVVLGSWSGTIGQLAAEIAAFWGASVQFGQETGTYSFVLNDRELVHTCGGAGAVYKSIGERCTRFAKQTGWKVPV
ncbi:NAD-dependent epimerase/dehydratase family protein [Micromonospora sp. STR1s_5]|nr:NAD-dependent epimerase/dehydratase family protein [Micromonospora sp. STR1s_5]